MRKELNAAQEAAKTRMDKSDAHRQARALLNRIGDRRATDQELAKLEELRRVING